MLVFFQCIYFNIFFYFYFHVGNKQQRFFKIIFFSPLSQFHTWKKNSWKLFCSDSQMEKKSSENFFYFYFFNFLLQNFFPPKKLSFSWTWMLVWPGLTSPPAACEGATCKLFRDISTKNSNLHSQCSNA